MVYFDNAATTPVPKAVADAMYEVLTAHFGNPSSQYPIGVEMKKAVEGWRAVIAGALGRGAPVLHLLRHGERQLGHTGRPVAEPAQGQTHHHHRRGAQRRSGALQAAGPAGV